MKRATRTQKSRGQPSHRHWHSRSTDDVEGLRREHRPNKTELASKEKLPSPDEYYMGIALAVREKANCKGNRIGAVIVRGNRVVSTGYNGVPEGMENCLDGGCLRCENSGTIFPSGTGYDLCICVHAEQNAILAAARFGIAVEGGTLYTTMRPCFGCAKELLQAKIERVVYLHEWSPDDPDPKMKAKKIAEYKKIFARIPKVDHLDMADPREEWAVTTKRPIAQRQAEPALGGTR
jgi:dCMP deaminase